MGVRLKGNVISAQTVVRGTYVYICMYHGYKEIQNAAVYGTAKGKFVMARPPDC